MNQSDQHTLICQKSYNPHSHRIKATYNDLIFQYWSQASSECIHWKASMRAWNSSLVMIFHRAFWINLCLVHASSLSGISASCWVGWHSLGFCHWESLLALLTEEMPTPSLYIFLACHLLPFGSSVRQWSGLKFTAHIPAGRWFTA